MSWTKEEKEELRRLINYERIEVIGHRLGKSRRMVRRMAKNLQLVKANGPKPGEDCINQVKELFDDNTYETIAIKTGISLSMVRRLVKELNLVNTPERRSRIMKKVMKRAFHKERFLRMSGKRRMKRELDTDHRLTRMRSKLAADGYIVCDNSNVVYYETNLKRHPLREQHAAQMGLVFKELTPDSNVIRFDGTEDDTDEL